MHIMSLLPRLGRLRAAFTLRVIEHAAAGGLKVVEAALGNFSMLSGVEIEKIPYNVNRIHAQLQGGDVGLAPREVASTVSYAKLSQETATWFVSEHLLLGGGLPRGARPSYELDLMQGSARAHERSTVLFIAGNFNS